MHTASEIAKSYTAFLRHRLEKARVSPSLVKEVRVEKKSPASVWTNTLHWVVGWNGKNVMARPESASNNKLAMANRARNEVHPVRRQDSEFV